MKKIVLTGGGSAGHVTPNIALVPKLRELGFDILYIGSQKGIEKDIIQKENITFKSISSGKLRRYFDIKNFTDPFRVVKGVFDARSILKKYRPALGLKFMISSTLNSSFLIIFISLSIFPIS